MIYHDNDNSLLEYRLFEVEQCYIVYLFTLIKNMVNHEHMTYTIIMIIYSVVLLVPKCDHVMVNHGKLI